MARVEVLWPFVKSYEGGFVDDPDDSGGATNMGVTIGTWKAQGYDKDGDGDIDVDDLRKITEADARAIFKRNYWNRWKADQIADQSVANILVDWTWCSGKNGIVIPQRILGVKMDGAVGPLTLAALNAREPRALFEELKEERKKFLERVCISQPVKKKYLAGWLRRNGDINYGSLKLNTVKETIITF